MSWTIAIQDGFPEEGVISTSTWFNTGGPDYSVGLDLGYDVCAFLLYRGLNDNTHHRSQYDNGSCLATLDSDCIDALQRSAEDLAMQLVSDPTPLPNSNLTADSFPGVCESIAASMTRTFPKQCEPYIDPTAYDPGVAGLTTNYNRTGLFYGAPNPRCTARATVSSNQTFYQVGAKMYDEVDRDTHLMYDQLAADTVWPLLTVFMPVADAARQVWTMNATSALTCTRITDFNPGSRIPAKAPEPTPVTPYRNSRRLSGGAIAGIVVGSVIGVAILFTVIILWRRRVRKSRASVVNEVSYSEMYEKGAVSTVGEIGDDKNRPELDHEAYRIPELPGARNPAEMEVNEEISRDGFRR